MLKTIGALLLLLVVATGAAVFYFIPNEFHKQVHKVYIPKVFSKMPQSFNIIDRDNHQSVLSGKQFTITLTSVSDINPLNYYLQVNILDNKSKKATETRITYNIDKNVELLAQFQNFKSNKNGESVAINGPVLKVSTPFSRKLLNEKERVDYLLFNTSIHFLVEEIKLSWKTPNKPEVINEGKILKLDLSTSAKLQDKEKMLLVLKSEVAEIDFNLNNVRNQGKNVSYSIILDSFNLTGMKSTYQDLLAMGEKKDEMPFLFKLMGAMPKIKKVVNFPFTLTNNVTAEHNEGPSSFDLDVFVDDPEKVNLLEAFKMKFSASSPASLFESQIPASLNGLMVLVYGKQFYPADKKNPLFILAVDSGAQQEKFAIEKEIQEKLPLIFDKYLNTEIDGKMRYMLILEEAINQKLIVKKQNSYVVKGDVVGMQFSLNENTNPMLTFMQIVPQEEITTLMQENGFFSVHATQETTLIPAP